MPLVRIDIVEGRPRDAIADLHRRVAELVAEILGSPLDRVRTYVTEIPATSWGIGGVPASIARADEIRARARHAGT